MKLIDQRTGVVNRLHKVLQQGKIKWSSVATDVLGVSGRAMILARIEGESDPERLANLANGRWKSKHEQWVESLEGRLNQDDRWVMKELWEQMEDLEEEVARDDLEIRKKMSPSEESLGRLMTMDLIERRSAENLLAEIGPERSCFASDDHLVRWAGLGPGSEESAKKNRSGKTPKGNQWLRRALVEPAWGAARRKDGDLGALARGMAARRGENWAVIAVARTLRQAAGRVRSEGVESKARGGA